jgi:hypothetical protein
MGVGTPPPSTPPPSLPPSNPPAPPENKSVRSWQQFQKGVGRKR